MYQLVLSMTNNSIAMALLRHREMSFKLMPLEIFVAAAIIAFEGILSPDVGNILY